jgi:hypothetical protein
VTKRVNSREARGYIGRVDAAAKFESRSQIAKVAAICLGLCLKSLPLRSVRRGRGKTSHQFREEAIEIHHGRRALYQICDGRQLARAIVVPDLTRMASCAGQSDPLPETLISSLLTALQYSQAN